LTWMLNISSNKSYPKPVKGFYLNNFAIKRQVMLKTKPYSGIPLYRAAIVEWIRQLKSRGYGIIQAPNATGYHAPPGNFSDWWYRMFIFGADEIVKGDFYFYPDGSVVEKFSPFRRLGKLFFFYGFKLYRISTRSYLILKKKPSDIFYWILSLPLVFIFLATMMMGSILAIFNRDYLFKKISAKENEHIV
ncbi:hypothetical protein K2P96_00290, partial [Patescibacteria group bacterium]|nr:hypothetical protein [Patescibacteria group bacterium]